MLISNNELLMLGILLQKMFNFDDFVDAIKRFCSILMEFVIFLYKLKNVKAIF